MFFDIIVNIMAPIIVQSREMKLRFAKHGRIIGLAWLWIFLGLSIMIFGQSPALKMPNLSVTVFAVISAMMMRYTFLSRRRMRNLLNSCEQRSIDLVIDDKQIQIPIYLLTSPLQKELTARGELSLVVPWNEVSMWFEAPPGNRLLTRNTNPSFAFKLRGSQRFIQVSTALFFSDEARIHSFARAHVYSEAV